MISLLLRLACFFKGHRYTVACSTDILPGVSHKDSVALLVCERCKGRVFA